MTRCGQCTFLLVFFLWTAYTSSCSIIQYEKGDVMGALESFPRITPFLWFDNQAEDAVNFYLSIFKNSRRLETVNNNGNRPEPATILTIAFELDGQKFT